MPLDLVLVLSSAPGGRGAFFLISSCLISFVRFFIRLFVPFYCVDFVGPLFGWFIRHSVLPSAHGPLLVRLGRYSRSACLGPFVSQFCNPFFNPSVRLSVL